MYARPASVTAVHPRPSSWRFVPRIAVLHPAGGTGPPGRAGSSAPPSRGRRSGGSGGLIPIRAGGGAAPAGAGTPARSPPPSPQLPPLPALASFVPSPPGPRTAATERDSTTRKARPWPRLDVASGVGSASPRDRPLVTGRRGRAPAPGCGPFCAITVASRLLLLPALLPGGGRAARSGWCRRWDSNPHGLASSGV